MAVAITVDEAAPDLTRLRFLFVNVYLWGTPASWVLIDGGLRGCAGTIMKVAADRFGQETPPQAVVLTHGHFDHVGAFPNLFEHWDLPVYAHRLEVPHLTGQSDYPPPDPTVGKGAMALMSSAYPNAASDFGARVRAYRRPHLAVPR
jgi:glyoxylase-like metal-dependent hydrolase (beta-lactamase superfamily II)